MKLKDLPYFISIVLLFTFLIYYPYYILGVADTCNVIGVGTWGSYVIGMVGATILIIIVSIMQMEESK